jgi:hypothetical protein
LPRARGQTGVFVMRGGRRSTTRVPSGIPAGGEGWGGTAKGGGDRPAAAFTPDTPTRIGIAGPASPERVRDRAEAARIRAERTQQLEDHLFRLATSAEQEITQVQASRHLHAIYNGQPVARNVNLNVDDVSQLTDDELRAELARASGAAANSGEGATPPGVSPQPTGIRH